MEALRDEYPEEILLEDILWYKLQDLRALASLDQKPSTTHPKVNLYKLSDRMLYMFLVAEGLLQIPQ